MATSIAGCSTKKDAFMNRTFHKLVTRDNSWFNANEKLKETVEAMQKAHADDYDEVLPIFVNGTEEEARAMVPELEICIEKCATVIDRHSMEFGGKEKNTWIPSAWFVIGRSHFYKRGYLDAARTFEYVGRRYKGTDEQMESKLWLARTSIELENYGKAQSTLDEITGKKTLPKKFPHDQLSAVQANLELHRGKVDNAITNLEHAVSITKVKKDRIRWSFILAQLYQMKGQQDRAIAMYHKVARMGPPYEMGFHAQIFQALALDRGDTKAIRQRLDKMLRDEKHRDHFDMIHYAIAELDLRDNLRDDAIGRLKMSTATSTVDMRQKAKSFLKLADLYFDDKQYPSAQQYYDSTSTLLSEEHPRFSEVTTRAEVLSDLVEQLNIISREDSLQALAQLDPEERDKRIRELIKERERHEERERQAAEDARELLAGQPLTPTKPAAGSGGAWYFYNPAHLSRGMADFRKKWGSRANEDDWRRVDKSGSALVDIAEEEELDEETTASLDPEGEPEWKDPEHYLKDIPLDEAMLDSSNVRICQALYLSGMIYKEKLKDVDNAIESFQVLNDRFDDCRYTPEAYYQLYRIYLAKEQAGNFMDFGGSSSRHYADIVLERWPGSEFARLVENPDLLQQDEANRMAEDRAYQDLYMQFRQGAYRGVITTCEGILEGEPRNHLRPKYALLRAMSIGGLRMMGPFREALEQVRDGYPGTDEAEAASALLDNLDNAAERPTEERTEKASPKAEGPSYTVEKGQHFVIIIIPESAGPIDPIKDKISDFNQRFFRNQPIEVRNTMWTGKDQVVLIRLFETRELAMTYYDLFKHNKQDLAGLNDRGYPLFAISNSNYQKLYVAKDTDGYAAFFDLNYLSGK